MQNVLSKMTFARGPTLGPQLSLWGPLGSDQKWTPPAYFFRLTLDLSAMLMVVQILKTKPTHESFFLNFQDFLFGLDFRNCNKQHKTLNLGLSYKLIFQLVNWRKMSQTLFERFVATDRFMIHLGKIMLFSLYLDVNLIKLLILILIYKEIFFFSCSCMKQTTIPSEKSFWTNYLP